MKKIPFKRAFTLIELLVVIAIIGILMSIVLASLIQARANSRDKIRISDIQMIKSAIRLYAEDNEGYPTSSNDSVNAIASKIAPYMVSVPTDPNGGTYGYDTSYNCSSGSSSGPNTVLYATFETLDGPTHSPGNCKAAADKYIIQIQ